VSNYVPGEGPSTAKLMLVGEAPGAEEEQEHRPFVGPSGEMVRSMLRRGGMDPHDVYITNVVKVRPPNNQLRNLHMIGRSVEEFIPQLWAEIDAIKPNCILAVGNLALQVLTGQRKITEYRGSILPNCRSVLPKVVPTVHPASILHREAEGMSSWKDMVFIQFDFERAIKQSAFPEINTPSRLLTVCRSSLELYRFLERIDTIAAIDVETFKTIPIVVALALSPWEAISIPVMDLQTGENPLGVAKHELVEIWHMLAEFFAGPIGKCGQNFKFDQTILERVGFEIRNFTFDTMLAFATLYPELRRRLEFIASVMTEEPFWKSEGREYNPKKDKFDRLLLYSAKDAAVTFEVMEVEKRELKELMLLDFFNKRVMPLHQMYREIESVGVLIDQEVRKSLRTKYSEQLKTHESELSRLVGYEVNADSPKQVAQLLYQDLRLPIRTYKGKPTTREEALDGMLRNLPVMRKDERKRGIVGGILQCRKTGRVIGTYLDANLSPDGRIRTEYNIVGTETGRTSTGILEPPLVPRKQGIALQTLTKHGNVAGEKEHQQGLDLRSMFIPDPGCVFFEADLSQAEARVVLLLAREYEALKKFDEIDIHILTASWIFNTTYEAVEHNYKHGDGTMRQLGKTGRHAGGYDESARGLAKRANISEYRARLALDAFHKYTPGIRGVFHAEVRQALQDNTAVLRTSFGRRRQFFNRWGDAMFREAYAYIPQSVISDHTKFSIGIIKQAIPTLRICLESHDSFTAIVPTDQIKPLATLTKQHLESPIDFSQCSLPRGSLVIPCEIKIGAVNWLDMRKYIDMDRDSSQAD